MDLRLIGIRGQFSRRDFLDAGFKALGLGALASPSVFGAGASSLGIEAGVPCTVSGTVDDRSLLLDPGCGIRMGPYGNPLLTPAAFHRVPLSSLSRVSFDIASARAALGMANLTDADIERHLQGCGLYQLIILFSGERHYRLIDLAKDPHNVPDIQIASDGLLTVTQAGRNLIEKRDGIYLQGLYRPDLNRFDPHGFIGVCGAQRRDRKIAVMELATPLLITENDSLSEPQDLLHSAGEQLVADSEHRLKGERIIIRGKNAWRYRVDPDSGLAVECKGISDSVGVQHDEKYVQARWDTLGPRLRYTVEKRPGHGMTLRPEVDLGKTLRLGASGDYIAGIVNYSLNAAGELVTARTTISGLALEAKVDVSTVRVEDGELIVGSQRNSVIDSRCKPHIVDSHGIDLYTASPEVCELMRNQGAINRIASRPISPFSIDIMAAYYRWKDLSLPA